MSQKGHQLQLTFPSDQPPRAGVCEGDQHTEVQRHQLVVLQDVRLGGAENPQGHTHGIHEGSMFY